MGMAWTHASICIPRLLNKTGAVLQSADAVLHSAGEVLQSAGAVLQSAGAVLNSASAVHPLFGLSSLLLYCNCYGLMPPFLGVRSHKYFSVIFALSFALILALYLAIC